MRLRLALTLILTWPMIAEACPGLLDVKLPTLTEDAVSLCRYEGKVLLVVNTASHFKLCGGHCAHPMPFQFRSSAPAAPTT